MSELPAAAAAELAAQLAALGEEFQRSLPGRIGEIETALIALGTDSEHWQQAALRELRDAAHRLAGAAGTFGHPLLAATASEIEQLAQQLGADPAAPADGAQEAFTGLLAGLNRALATDEGARK